MNSICDFYLAGTIAASSGNTSILAAGYDQATGQYDNHALDGIATVAIDIRGAFTATLQFEALVAGTWVAISGTPVGGGAAVTSATAAGQWFFSVAGNRNIRVRCSAFTSAPTTIAIRGSVAGGGGTGSSSGGGGSISPTQGAITTTTPSVATATSVTILAANANRKYLNVQNDTSANIMISLSGATLTDIVPSATNIGIVLVPGASYENNASFCPTGAVTAYQTSGGTVRTIVVMEG